VQQKLYFLSTESTKKGGILSSCLKFRVSYILKVISKYNDTIFTLKYSSCLRHLIVIPVSVVTFIISITLYTDLILSLSIYHLHASICHLEFNPTAF
jgi:hypothetical protein